MKVLYEAIMTNTGGREGHVEAPDQSLALNIAPPEKKVENTTNPEQLFAAGYSSCFNGALELMLRRGRAEYDSTRVTAKVRLLESPEDKGFKIGVTLLVHIEGMPLDEARGYVDKAHAFCPYSKATRGNVDVELEVE